MWVRKYFAHGIRRPDRHFASEQLHDLRLGQRLCPGCHLRFGKVLIGRAARIATGAFILDEIGTLHSFAKILPVAFYRRSNRHPPVFGREQTERYQGAFTRATVFASEAVGRNMRAQQRQHCIVHRHIKKRTLSGSLGLMHRRHQPQRHQSPRIYVGNCYRKQISGGLHQATSALPGYIQTRPIRVWAVAGSVIAITAHGTVDNPWVTCSDYLITQSHLVHNTSAHVFDNRISLFTQGQQAFLILSAFQIQNHAALVAIYPRKGHAIVRAVTLFKRVLIVWRKRRDRPKPVTTWWFNLDHVCPQIGEQCTTKRTGIGHGAIDNGQIFQRSAARRGLCRFLCHGFSSCSVDARCYSAPVNSGRRRSYIFSNCSSKASLLRKPN